MQTSPHYHVCHDMNVDLAKNILRVSSSITLEVNHNCGNTELVDNFAIKPKSFMEPSQNLVVVVAHNNRLPIN